MPLCNWRTCMSGDMTGVRINPDKGKEKEDVIAWEQCYDTFISRFGLPEEYDKYLELIKKKAIAELDFIRTSERYRLNTIRRLEAEIQKNFPAEDGEKTDYYASALTSLRKWMGQWINDKVITACEFFETMEEYNKWVKQQNAAHGKKHD